MILIIRISGMVNVPSDVQETLHRLRLRRKYSAVLLSESKELSKLLKKVRNHVSYGEIKKETTLGLLKKRGKILKSGTKLDAEKIADSLDKKTLKELGVKPFFRLHPPIGGIDAKKHFGTTKKAVLGHNKKMDELVGRML